MTHKELTVALTQWLLSQLNISLAIDEIAFCGGKADVLGITTRLKVSQHKVMVIEAKTSRSDLLQDLKAKKLLKYERKASHCYLAALPEAFKGSTTEEIISDLVDKGLPDTWGIILVSDKIKVLRKATRIRNISIASIRSLILQIAKSSMYKQYKPFWNLEKKRKIRK